MADAIIFDLDGTLADCEHRKHHVTKHPKNWDAFFEGIGDDQPIEPVRRLLVMAYHADLAVLICSGRPEKCRTKTVEWLAKHEIPFDAFYMRPDNDTRPDHVVKGQLLDGIIADGYEPFLVVDDRESVVGMWRERGLICLQNKTGDFDDIEPGLLTVMVGPSGAGKSTWLQGEQAKAMGIHPSHIVSSDQIRIDLCGDFRVQDRNDDVFQAVHAIAKARVRSGVPAVIDATNLRRKDRMACAMLNTQGLVRYVILDRPMDEKYRDADWRASLQFDLIAKHQATFQSQIKDILEGDDLPHVTVHDLRTTK